MLALSNNIVDCTQYKEGTGTKMASDCGWEPFFCELKPLNEHQNYIIMDSALQIANFSVNAERHSEIARDTVEVAIEDLIKRDKGIMKTEIIKAINRLGNDFNKSDVRIAVMNCNA